MNHQESSDMEGSSCPGAYVEEMKQISQESLREIFRAALIQSVTRVADGHVKKAIEGNYNSTRLLLHLSGVEMVASRPMRKPEQDAAATMFMLDLMQTILQGELIATQAASNRQHDVKGTECIK